ncbi:MAG: OmpA family protein [Pseudomonadales bacterium]|nr:OmpA family protein [Pseudomonadales bacterium]
MIKQVVRRFVLSFFLALGAMFTAFQAVAHEFVAGLGSAEWHLEPSALDCKLWQEIPHYGLAVFQMGAGEKLSFYLESDRPVFEKSEAELMITAPFWRPGVDSYSVGKVESVTGKRPISLGNTLANKMVDELVAGLIPKIYFQNPNHPVQVAVSAVNFQDAYNGLVSCLAGLFPANYDQLSNSFLLFGTNKYGLKDAAKQRLDMIAGYLNIDPEVSHIYVYGHTDTIGRRGHNWELSRLRAKEVKDYLIKKGVDPEMITTNYYGETRPRVKEKSGNDRSKNRRVYVRLKKST